MNHKLKVEATKNKSNLVNSIGFWSKKSVSFNNEDDKVIIINDSLIVADFKPMIKQHLEHYLKDDLKRFVQDRMNTSNVSFIDLIKKKNPLLKHFFILHRSPLFDRPEFKIRGRVSSTAVGDWLTKTYETEELQINAFIDLMSTSILHTPEIVRPRSSQGLHNLHDALFMIFWITC